MGVRALKGLEVISKCVNNAMIVFDECQEDEIGLGLYLGPSALDHNCIPNAECVFMGRTAIVTCIKPIKSFNECRISYADFFAPRKERHEWLKHHYFFECKCKECLFEEPGSKVREKLKHGAWRCTACQNSSPISMKKCRICGADGTHEISLYKKMWKRVEQGKGVDIDTIEDDRNALSGWPYEQRMCFAKSIKDAIRK